ncbi:MAG: hypothetical protein Q8Q09_25705 [Deltaproteobacteria bacterium]|nr:hypothetical protein [Deltaproteobacteria bacterium]
MMNPVCVTRLSVIVCVFSLGCGNTVSPLQDAGDVMLADVHASLVTLRLTSDFTAVRSGLGAAAVRAESASGEVIERVTDIDGRVTFALTEGQRWDVTFAHRNIGAISIIGLRPEAVTREVEVFKHTFRDRFPLWRPDQRERRLSDVPVRIVRATTRGFTSRTFAAAGPIVVLAAQTPASPTSTVEMAFNMLPGQTGIDVVALLGVQETLPTFTPLPVRYVHHRIEPVPEGDVLLELDLDAGVPVASARFHDILPSQRGMVSPACANEFAGVAGRIIGLADREQRSFSSLLIGTISTQPPTAASPWRLRTIVASNTLLRTDDEGPLYVARHGFGCDSSDGTRLGIDVSPNPAVSSEIRVPELDELKIRGNSLANVEISAKGSYEQLGFELSYYSPNGPGSFQWVGYNFDPMESGQRATTHIPRLPGGITLASLLELSEGLYVVNAVVSTLPRTKPAYGFWREGLETVRVTTQARDLRP